MGATPRTLSNVILHINGKLEAAGVQTRLAREKLPAEPRTLEVGGKTVTLPAGADQWGLRVKGVSVETVSFGAPDRSERAAVADTVTGAPRARCPVWGAA